MKKTGLAFLVFFAFTILYLWPAPLHLGQSGIMAGSGGDETTVPYYYDWIPRLLRVAPLSLLSGALVSPQIGAPAGALLWIPTIERAVAIVAAPFVPPESVPLVFIFTLHVLAALSAYGLARHGLRLTWAASVALGIAFAYTPALFWRGQMHQALAGVYAVALLVWGFVLLLRAEKRRDLVCPSFLFLGVLTSAHYLIIIALTWAPVLTAMAWIWRAREGKKSLWLWPVFVPLVLGLFWIRLGVVFPLGWDRDAYPPLSTSALAEGNRDWDVLVYSAKPLHYLGGVQGESWDWNPLRKWITERIRAQNIDNYYPQELSSGVRWCLIWGALLVWLRRKKLSHDQRAWMKLALGLALWSLWCSLSPRVPAPLGVGVGPSRWIHALIPEVRAPNRWSVGVHLGLAMVSAIGLHHLIEAARSSRARVVWIFFAWAVLILDFPPTLRHPEHKVVDAMVAPTQGCGLGVVLPYRHAGDLRTYEVISSLRGTDCRVLNAQNSPRADAALVNLFGNEATVNQEVLDCLGVTWILWSDRRREVRSGSGLKSAPRSDWWSCLGIVK